MNHPFLLLSRSLSPLVSVRSLVLCAALTPSLACSHDPQAAPDAAPGPTTVDGGTIDSAASVDAASDAGDGSTASACTDLANDGPVVRPTVVDAPLPTGTGGVVPPGRSSLVAVRYYSADIVVSPTETWQEAARFNGGRYAIVFRRNGGVEQRTAGDLTFSGTKVTTTPTCPSADSPRDAQYSASGDTFWIIDAKDARVLEFQRTGP